MRQIPPGLRNLLILIALFELAKYALPRVGFDMSELYLFYPDSPSFRPWTLVTHMFCHGPIWHILFNSLVLFSFGAIVEAKLGTSKFLKLFFISGFGAVLVHFISVGVLTYQLSGSFFPYHDGMLDGLDANFINAKLGYGPMVGASGAIYGIMLGFVHYYPNERMIFFFIPYPLKAKVIIPIMLLIDLILGFGQFSGDPVAHFAHIGGAITGYITVRIWAWNKIKGHWH